MGGSEIGEVEVNRKPNWRQVPSSVHIPLITWAQYVSPYYFKLLTWSFVYQLVKKVSIQGFLVDEKLMSIASIKFLKK